MSGGQKRKKDKKYYVNQAKKAKLAQHQIVPDLRGFLLFCNHREKEAIREGYNILNEFADIDNEANGSGEDDREQDEEEDLQKVLEKEKSEIVANDKVKRFQVVGSGVQNLLFIKCSDKSIDPVDLSGKIVDSIKEKGERKTRHLIRLIPVQITCKAFDEDIEKAVTTLIESSFKALEGSHTFCVAFKSRLNANLDRDDVIKSIAGHVKKVNSNVTVKFKDPDWVIIVEVMKKICCLSIVPNYFQRKKFNLLEIAPDSTTSTDE